PASFPAVFCGAYSDQQSSSSGFCGLPAPLSSIQSLRTGWRWAPNGNNSQYNASYDVWLGSQPNTGSLSGYFMVWLRDPPGQQPANNVREYRVTVPNVPGTWD